MSVASVFFVHALKTGSFSLSQIKSSRCAPQTEQIVGRSAGAVDVLFRSIAKQEPMFSLTTTQLATVLGSVGLYGADLSGGNTDLELKKGTAYGTRVAIATTEHERLRIAKAFCCWSKISARHQEEATLDLDVYAVYDGSNEPIVPAGSVAATVTAAYAEAFTCGPASLNGSSLGAVLETTIESGCKPKLLSSDGEIWPTLCLVEEIETKITLKTLTAASLRTYTLDGTAISSGAVYLRKKALNGTNVADGTAEHIKFTLGSGGGIIHVLDVSQPDTNGNVETTLELSLVGAPPATLSAASAIT